MDVFEDVIDDMEYNIKYYTEDNTIIGYNSTINIKEQLKNMEYGE